MIELDHTPVLLEETLELLKADRPGLYVDCTLGLGGHASQILERNPEASLIAFDLDESALLKARDKLASHADRIELYHSDFRYLPEIRSDFQRVRGILIDLGLSSFQLDNPARGFSYSHDGPLDMRMDHRNKVTAAKILNKASEHRLSKIFWEYGELRQSSKLARAIVTKRKIRKIERTVQLLEIVEEVCRWRPQKGKTHPAARVFQSLRIVVNNELEGIEEFLEHVIHRLPPTARVAAISFHSLEDRIIKRTFQKMAKPEGESPWITILTKKPVRPSDREIELNFRSRSAKLRAAERT